jgi:hypothetical protein
MLTPSRNRRARVLLGACLAAVALTFSPRSFAQNSEVNTLIETGLERYKRQDYEGARWLFARAHEVEPSEVGILFNLALAELHSGHRVEAANHLRAFIASPQAQADRRESARTKWLHDAEAQIGRVSIEAPAGTAVSVDGAAVGVAPFEQPVYVTPGDHEVTAKLGSDARSMHVNAPVGNVVTAHFDPVPAPSPAPSPPLASAPLASERPALLEVPPSPPRRSPSTAKIVTVVVLGASAAIAAGAGITVALDVQTKQNAYTSQNCENLPPQTYNNSPCGGIAQGGKSEGTAADVLYIGAGALAGAALVTWFIWPNHPVTSSWTLRPSFDGRTATAVLGGSF